MFKILLQSCFLVLAFSSIVRSGVLPNHEAIKSIPESDSAIKQDVEENREFTSEQMAPAVDGLLTSVGSYISPMLGSFKPTFESLSGIVWPALSTLGSHMAASAVNGLGNLAANIKPGGSSPVDKGDSSYDAFVVKIPNYGSYVLLANPGGPMVLSSALGDHGGTQFIPQYLTQQQKPLSQKPFSTAQKPHKPQVAVTKPQIVLSKPDGVIQKPSVQKPQVAVPKPQAVVQKPQTVGQKPSTFRPGGHPGYYGMHGHKELEHEESDESLTSGFQDYEEYADSDLEENAKDIFDNNEDSNDLNVVEAVSIGRVQLLPVDSEADESMVEEDNEMHEAF